MGVSATGVTRAYALLDVKSVDDEQRIVEGMATTPETDRMDDVVESKGAEFKLPIPLLWQHDHQQPIGEVFSAKVTADGIRIRARLAKTDTPGTLKSRLDEAWESIRIGLVKGLSIGFKALETARIEGSFGTRFLKWQWLELSAVTIPANGSALIQSIKAADAAHLALSGNGAGTHTTAVAGIHATARKGARLMKSITEQIAEYKTTRAAKAARMTELMNKAAEEGRTLDANESDEYDGLEAEVESLDAHVARLEKAVATAKPVADAKSPEKAAAVRDPEHRPVITVKSNVPAGIGFARFVACKTQAKIDGVNVVDLAKQRYPDHSELHAFIQKATVPAGTTSQAVYAEPLVYAQNLASEFVEYLRPQTIVGKLNLTRVPFNVRVPTQTNGGHAAWVGEGAGKPVTSVAFSSVSLDHHKLATIAVLTKELVRLSTPSAEMLVRNTLAGAIIEQLDRDFIDPATAAVAGVNPASITNGLTALTSAGTSADNARTDLAAILKTYLEANQDPSGLAFIMPPTLAMALSLMRNSLGQKEFPDINANGGTLEGFPVVTSQLAANASGAGNLVIAVKQSDIFLADDGNVAIDVSEQASVQMSDAPTINSTTGTGASLVSLWQTNSVGIRAEREITWTKARSTAVVYMDDVNWGSIGSPA